MGWMTKEFWSDSMAGRRDFQLLQNVQTLSVYDNYTSNNPAHMQNQRLLVQF